MSTTLYYFLQVILCSGIMVGYYWLVLRNNRFHQYNRFYLLAIALFSWIVPLIKIQWNKPVETDPQLIQFFSVIADSNTEIESKLHTGWFQYGWQGILMMIYAMIAFVLLIGLIKSLIQIYRLLQTHSCKTVGEIFLVLTKAKGAPFSFFSYIFWHESIDLKSDAGKQMMQHELTHVQQKHSIDKIIMQLVLIAGWFNPFFWLIKKEMEMIHEFIADKKAVANGDTASLAQMLLAAAYPQQHYLLTNPFFFSPIKRRLQMITKSNNPRFSYMRRLIVLPLLAIVVVLFAFRAKELRGEEIISVGTLVDKIAEQNYFKHKEQTNIKDTTILNSDSVYIIPKGKNVQLISEGKDSSKAILLTRIAMQDKMNFNSMNGSISVSVGKENGFLKITSPNMDSIPPLFVIDGVKMEKMSTQIDPNSIKEITVLKNKSAVELYGEEGKHGVILITTKNKSSLSPVMALQLNNTSLDSVKFVKGQPLHLGDDVKMRGYVTVKKEGKINPNPLVIVNNQPVYDINFDEVNINPKDIESVNVLKGDSATKKYGDAAEYGALEIKTKNRMGFSLKNIADDPSGTKAFLKKNPAIKRVSWNHNPLRMNLEFKDGTLETYNLSNYSSAEKAMNKYGKLSLPTPPPPPPLAPAKLDPNKHEPQ